jgi:hypothetical protein
MHGTSMAAPHVTGAIARYLSTMWENPRPTPAEVARWLDSMATKDNIIYENNDEETSPNKLLYIDCADFWETPAGSDANRPGMIVLVMVTVAALLF